MKTTIKKKDAVLRFDALRLFMMSETTEQLDERLDKEKVSALKDMLGLKCNLKLVRATHNIPFDRHSKFLSPMAYALSSGLSDLAYHGVDLNDVRYLAVSNEGILSIFDMKIGEYTSIPPSELSLSNIHSAFASKLLTEKQSKQEEDDEEDDEDVGFCEHCGIDIDCDDDCDCKYDSPVTHCVHCGETISDCHCAKGSVDSKSSYFVLIKEEEATPQSDVARMLETVNPKLIKHLKQM